MPEQSKRISLAELRHGVKAWHTSRDFDEGAPLTMGDLTGTLPFSPGDGRIWLNGQRMVLGRSPALPAPRACRLT